MNTRVASPAPNRLYTATESRAFIEYSMWRLVRPMLSGLPSGDGHPVLVLPGFTAGDRSTIQLRILLRKLGYRTYRWKLGANLGPTHHIVEGLPKRFDEIFEREQRPISIVGWSLGGIYARSLARSYPDTVRQVITMGSPFKMVAGDPSAASAMWDSLGTLHDHDAIEAMREIDHSPLPVPTTSIYTRSDGIVHWRTCLETKSDTAENVEVFGSHCGLGFNAWAAGVVADRLAQPEGEWKKFRAPLWALGAYPRPANYRPPRQRRPRRRSGNPDASIVDVVGLAGTP